MNRSVRVNSLANRMIKILKPYCNKIKIVGSIRRRDKNPKDIDIVLIPKNRINLEEFMKIQGKYLQGGEKESTWKVNGIKVELYYSKSEEWGAMLLAYSGKKGSNIGLRIIARTKGFKLTRYGLFNRKSGKRIAGKTEREIYEALKRKYKSPSER
jgi:DNA polymerase (family X)